MDVMEISNTNLSLTESSKTSSGARKKAQARRKRRFYFSGFLIVALLFAGTAEVLLKPSGNTATAEPNNQKLIEDGKTLYQNNCMSCHGMHLEGIGNRGPSLVGVGEANVYFQVTTGRMPAEKIQAQAKAKPPKFNEYQAEAMAMYIQALSPGSRLYRDSNGKIAGTKDLTNGNMARGSELFRTNCASCHNFAARGGALSSGKYAPAIVKTHPQQIYDAMLIGPQSMPAFSNHQLTPDQKKDIITFIYNTTHTTSPGGYSLGLFGPTSEGIAIWIVGISLIVGLAMWIGSKA